MTDTTELLEAARAVLPFLNAPNDHYDEMKMVDKMPKEEASRYLRRSMTQPDETPAQKLRREADEMEAKDAIIKRFRAAVESAALDFPA